MDKIFHCFYEIIHKEGGLLNKKYDTKVIASDEDNANKVALKEVSRIFPTYKIVLECVKEIKPNPVLIETYKKERNIFMVKTVSSQELKTDVDLVCAYCGEEHKGQHDRFD